MKLTPEVELLKGALDLYSPTGNTAEIGEYLVKWSKEHDMDAEVKNDMAIINPKAVPLLLLGHMDTVEGRIKVELKADKLYGRGAADAKGPLCAALAAVEKHKVLREHVCIIAVPDEEGDSKAALHIRDNWQERPCIILEPSTWSGITLSYMGRLGIKCSIECPPSHPGHLKPFATEELYNTWNNLAKDHIVRIRKIEGNDTNATMNLDIRFRTESPEEILSKFPESNDVVVMEKTLPYTAKKNTILTRAFLRAIREMDGTPVFKKKTGTSDMNILGEIWHDAPMLAYGPGDGNLGHTDNEHISINEYLKGIEVFARALSYIIKN